MGRTSLADLPLLFEDLEACVFEQVQNLTPDQLLSENYSIMLSVLERTWVQDPYIEWDQGTVECRDLSGEGGQRPTWRVSRTLSIKDPNYILSYVMWPGGCGLEDRALEQDEGRLFLAQNVHGESAEEALSEFQKSVAIYRAELDRIRPEVAAFNQALPYLIGIWLKLRRAALRFGGPEPVLQGRRIGFVH